MYNWKDLTCLWSLRLNIVNISILPKLIYRFNVIPIKISASIFVYVDELILKFIWKGKVHIVCKTILILMK